MAHDERFRNVEQVITSEEIVVIPVNRDRLDSTEIQSQLETVRVDRLPVLRKLIRDRASAEEIEKNLSGYQIVRTHLWKSQHEKCCYCEKKEEDKFNDVEHYRPKSKYWWLTFTWKNLMFACEQCNRSGKNDEFPLLSMAEQLQPDKEPPGNEKPILLDPSDIRVNPVEHIEFLWKSYYAGGPERWVAKARNNSPFGAMSIQIYDLNRDGLFALRDSYVNTNIEPIAKRFNRYLDADNIVEAKHTYAEAIDLFKPQAPYVALTYDAFRHFVPNERLTKIHCSWPEPSQVGIARAPRPVVRPAKSLKPTR